MIIYKDIMSGAEMFTDAYKVKEIDDGYILSVQGQMSQQKSEALSDSLFGGNASAEDGGGCDEYDAANAKTGIDIVMAHDLEDQSHHFTSKKHMSAYLKAWSKLMIKAFQDDEEKIDCFKKACVAKLKEFCNLWSISDVSVYSGQQFDATEPVSSIIIGKWTDGMNITFYAFKYGLEEIKL